MISHTNSKPIARSPQPIMPPPPPPSGSSGSSASVPISVYREVAAELQASRSQMQRLQAHNQRLSEQNQDLRLEIERVVQSALHLRQKADAYAPGEETREFVDPDSEAPAPKKSRRMPRFQSPPPEGLSDRLYTEQAEPLPRRTLTPKSGEMSGLWLMMMIFLIIVTAFGAGFLIVRPLLPSNNR